MRKLIHVCFAVFVVALAFCMPVFAAGDDWKTAPKITHAYELSKEKIALEWEGKADQYLVLLDGKAVSNVNIKSASINLKEGQHTINILPIKKESKDVDTKIAIDIAAIGGGSIDLGTLGVDPKRTVQGTQSEPFKINYSIDTFFNAVPEVTGAYTDFDDRVLLTFTDKYDSDIYNISIKSGKDIIPTEFDTADKDAAKLIDKQNSTVTITLDQKYLKNHGWMIPELDEKYGFSVMLGKHPKNYVDDKRESSSIIESKESKYFDYTPYAAWKNAPEITYASQTADGQVTLKWEHDDNKLGCEYKVVSLDKVLVVKTGEKELGKTNKKEFVVKDLMNGKHTLAVIPVLKDEDGLASENQIVDVENNWVVAPSLECSLKGGKDVLLKWEAPEGVENYHITVSAGSGSLLRFVNLDYKKYKEFDVPAKQGKMEYTFTYDQNVESEDGVKLKFEIYGTRKTEKGEEQKSATSKQTITLK